MSTDWSPTAQFVPLGGEFPRSTRQFTVSALAPSKAVESPIR
jgi:hypothetical protein